MSDAQTPASYPAYPQQPSGEGRPVSFYLAIFLAMLLVISVGLNVVLLFVGVIGSAAGGFGAFDDTSWELVSVGGDTDAKHTVLRIPVEGAIAEHGNPFLGAAGGSVSQLERALRLARRDANVVGVVLAVNSPGGGVTDSDRMYRMLREFRQDTGKPLIAHLGDIAASGGYYIALACDQIVCSATTITGSIGVVMSTWNWHEAAARVGIDEIAIVSERTPYKTMLSSFEAPDDGEIAIVRSIVDEMYDRFVDVVVEGRSMLTRERIVELADGRIYSAQQALRNGLVDAVGDREAVLAILRSRLDEKALRVVEQRRRPSLFDGLFGIRSQTPADVGELVARLASQTTGARLLYFWPGGR